MIIKTSSATAGGSGVEFNPSDSSVGSIYLKPNKDTPFDVYKSAMITQDPYSYEVVYPIVESEFNFYTSSSSNGNCFVFVDNQNQDYYYILNEMDQTLKKYDLSDNLIWSISTLDLGQLYNIDDGNIYFYSGIYNTSDGSLKYNNNLILTPTPSAITCGYGKGEFLYLCSYSGDKSLGYYTYIHKLNLATNTIEYENYISVGAGSLSYVTQIYKIRVLDNNHLVIVAYQNGIEYYMVLENVVNIPQIYFKSESKGHAHFVSAGNKWGFSFREDASYFYDFDSNKEINSYITENAANYDLRLVDMDEFGHVYYMHGDYSVNRSNILYDYNLMPKKIYATFSTVDDAMYPGSNKYALAPLKKLIYMIFVSGDSTNGYIHTLKKYKETFYFTNIALFNSSDAPGEDLP